MIAQTERLIVRNWRPEDEDAFHRLNSDDTIMQFFPFRRSREQSREVMEKTMREINETGYGFSALQTQDDETAIGILGLSVPQLEPLVPGDSVEIGWRLVPEVWGKGYITEASKELLRIGFQERGLEEIVAFAVPANTRSTAVMDRIGMRHSPSRDFDHPFVPDSHIHLRRHAFYAVTAADWAGGQD
ncbi:GNAT family N-acetyltransferase [Hoeflea poritis]|uniref:GNAT family N-acetyltransferase n=1 Tax=Hoeflea poritis TaxID=2993659 RepID=A0ABT4VP00_9HYPH|nr:GNAT family N-acetyltransferase [Hoeflea poritis]MDA4846441.1 GNAT family N-acetyltransferase [Hoeflea poritis]